MKTYEPAKAASILKTGPSGKTYHFMKDKELGPETLADQRWMDNLTADGVLRVVTDNTPPSKKEPKPEKPDKKVVTSDDVLPELQPKTVKRDPGRRTKEQKEAEEKLAKQVEAAEKKAAENEAKAEAEPTFADEQQQEFYEFVKSLRGKNFDGMIDAIKAEYLKEPLVELAEKFEVESEGKKADIIANILDKLSV